MSVLTQSRLFMQFVRDNNDKYINVPHLQVEPVFMNKMTLA